MTDDPWDLLVVGGGTAGLVAAKTAVALGARALLAERDRPGGECLWTGCVPSKALLAAAHTAAAARSAHRFGVDVDAVTVDFPRVMRHVRGVIARIEPVDSFATLRAAGVQVRSGDVRFTGRDRAEIGAEAIRFRQAVVATGSAPVVPDVPGLSGALTSDSVWELDERPERLLVIGGGSIGCELGQAFARLGSTVTLTEAASRLLSREDPDAAALVEAALTADGVAVTTNVSLHRVDGPTAYLSDGRRLEVDAVLVAVGRRARTAELGLDAAGVDVDGHGWVVTDAHLRTSNPRIWAAGDVTGRPQFTHLAGVHGSTAATNAVLGLRRRAQTEAIPRVTFTQPEVGAVGIDTSTNGYRIVTVDHDDLDRAVTDDATDGFTRLALDGRDRLVGATVVGPRAGETLGELTLAVRHRMRVRDVAAATHAYPTFGDGVWNAAVARARATLSDPIPARAITTLGAVRRRWVSRGDAAG